MTKAQQYFDQTLETSQRAIDTMGAVESFHRIGGCTVALRFAGPALVPVITGPLHHLVIEPEPPDVTVVAWDSTSTGIRLQPPAWRPDGYALRGEVAGYDDERFATVLQPGVGALNLFDRERARGVFWVGDPSRLTGADHAAPLLRVLQAALSRSGRQVVHAAAIGDTRGGVLIVGPGGAGKSTTALRCLELGFAADDYCFVAAGDEPVVHSLFGTLRVDATCLEGRPDLRPLVANPRRGPGEKALLMLTRTHRQWLTPSFPLRAVLVAQVTGRRETRLTPTSQAEALAALAPSTIGQLAGTGRGALSTMGAVVRGVPAHRLELGTDVKGIRDVLGRFLP